MRPIKPAATIMLIRENPLGFIETLLLRRNKALNFASGFWVFPGGKIDREEMEKSESDLDAARIAAVRETKEEANIDVLSKDLVFFSHWTTPVIEPRRYATWFFYVDVSNQPLEVQVDGSEVEEHLWITPQSALDKAQTSEIIMMPPTYVSLQRIRKCRTMAEVHLEMKRSEPLFILPVIDLKNQTMHCMYEGDAGYSTTDANTPGPRHRLVGNMLKGGYEFLFSNCEGVFPVNGGRHL